MAYILKNLLCCKVFQYKLCRCNIFSAEKNIKWWRGSIFFIYKIWQWHIFRSWLCCEVFYIKKCQWHILRKITVLKNLLKRWRGFLYKICHIFRSWLCWENIVVQDKKTQVIPIFYEVSKSKASIGTNN